MILMRTLLVFGWLNCLYFGFYFFKEKQTFDEFINFYREFYFDWEVFSGIFGGGVAVVLGILNLILMGISFMAILTMIKEWITKGKVTIFKNLE